MELIQDKNSRAGVIGTILFHLLLLLLFVQFGMAYQDPPPENKGGMVINFGTSDDGMGDEQPTNTDNTNSENPTENTSPSANNTAEENVLTQENNESINVSSAETPAENTDPEPTISDNLANALNTANNAQNSSEGDNEGETGNPGDQGNPNGDPNSNNHTKRGSGGIKYSLGGRGKISFKKPENPTQEDGTVIVDIWVDQNGKVIRAKPGARGSTTSNSILLEKAKEAAYKALFKKDPNAPFEQKGTMTFVFILN